MSAVRAEVVRFPVREIEVVPFVNERNAIAVRNRRATDYSMAVSRKEKFRAWEKKHEDGLLFLSGFCFVATFILLYFVGVIL